MVETAEPGRGPGEKRKGVYARLGPAGPVALVFLFGPPLGGFALAYFANTVAQWFRSQDTLGLFMFAAGFALFAGIGLLPTYIQCGVAGFAFGLVHGSVVTMLGVLGAAALGYTIARRASGDRVLAMLAEAPKWLALRNALLGVDAKGHGFWRTLGLVTLVRIPPNSPFALTNFLMASVKVSRPVFLLGTVIGLAPRTLLAVYIGASIKQTFSKEALEEGGVRGIFWIGLGVSFLVVLVIVWIANRALKRITAGAPQRSDSHEQGVECAS